MKMKKPLFIAGAMSLLLVGATLAACSDDNKGPHYPDTQTFRQVLRVEQWNDGTINAFADFQAISVQTNKLVSCELGKESSITANGVKLIYSKPDPDDPYSYAYGETITAPDQEVTFVFTRKPGLTFTNRIKIGNTPFIRLPSTTVLENNTRYTYTSSLGTITNSAIRIYVIGKSGDQMSKRYDAIIFNDTYYFEDVPAGTNVLQSTATDEIPLQEENGTSGGALYSTKVFEIPTVTFK